MNKLKYIFGICLIGMFFSCEDEIDVTLEDSETFTVVDAFINNNSEAQIINLTKSQSYFNNSVPQGVQGATVSVSSSGGGFFNFEDQGNGVYQWSPSSPGENIGDIGETFTLNITEGNEEYTSTVILNESPEIDSITYEDRDELFFDGIFAEFFARDLPGLGDTYWIKSFRNGVYSNKPEEINIAYDSAFDSGAEVDNFIFITPIRELINPLSDSLDGTSLLMLGDDLRVEIHSINFDVFSFLETARDQILNGQNGIFAEPLANSEGNIESVSGNKTVLGVFCVSHITSMEIKIE